MDLRVAVGHCHFKHQTPGITSSLMLCWKFGTRDSNNVLLGLLTRLLVKEDMFRAMVRHLILVTSVASWGVPHEHYFWFLSMFVRLGQNIRPMWLQCILLKGSLPENVRPLSMNNERSLSWHSFDTIHLLMRSYSYLLQRCFFIGKTS